MSSFHIFNEYLSNQSMTIEFWLRFKNHSKVISGEQTGGQIVSMDLIDYYKKSLTNKLHVMDISLDDSGSIRCSPFGLYNPEVFVILPDLDLSEWTHVVCSFKRGERVMSQLFQQNQGKVTSTLDLSTDELKDLKITQGRYKVRIGQAIS